VRSNSSWSVSFVPNLLPRQDRMGKNGRLSQSCGELLCFSLAVVVRSPRADCSSGQPISLPPGGTGVMSLLWPVMRGWLGSAAVHMNRYGAEVVALLETTFSLPDEIRDRLNFWLLGNVTSVDFEDVIV
jgi:hypothetical protein